MTSVLAQTTGLLLEQVLEQRDGSPAPRSQVPANRIGYTALSLPQLKILQEVLTLAVFVPFSVFYMQNPVKLDFLWAGLCIVGAVYFMFRS